jgi:hypothetical protein
VARRCVWSRNLENEEAKARYQAVKKQPQWVVTAGKQMDKQLLKNRGNVSYVVDILITYDHTNITSTQILHYANTTHSNLQFKLALDSKASVNVVDLFLRLSGKPIAFIKYHIISYISYHTYHITSYIIHVYLIIYHIISYIISYHNIYHYHISYHIYHISYIISHHIYHIIYRITSGHIYHISQWILSNISCA